MLHRKARRSRPAGPPAALTGTLLVLAASATVAFAQWGRGPWAIPKFAASSFRPDDRFSFCRVHYDSVRYEDLGHGWNTDYPDSDQNLMLRLGQLTTVRVRTDRGGNPDNWVVRLTDPQLFSFPFVFMSDVGTVHFSSEESAALRGYLLRGGFLWVDDFWGERAWEHWQHEIGRALDPTDYPIVDIPLDHGIFRTFFTVREVPQVPSIQYWSGSGGGTSERGLESEQPHFRGIFDHHGRLLVVMSHNTDIADGWEREGESREFFERFSVTKSYPLGVNVVLYSLSH